jgi:methionyl-tRNA formyltransferase
MKVLLFIGNHLRHKHIAQMLYQKNLLAGIVFEEREEFIPTPPENVEQVVKELFITHFEDRAIAENKFFGTVANFAPDVPILSISKEELNGEKTKLFIKNTKHDLGISYGIHKLEQETIELVTGERWNIHGGLSPWYRGNTTLFWPSYMLEPQLTGMTVHCLTQKLDGGDIVHHSVPELVRDDKIHDLSCRAVLQVANDLPRLIEKLERKELRPYLKQKYSGKLWIENDWKPEHLKVVYELYKNNVVNDYLDGKISQRTVKLYLQF